MDELFESFFMKVVVSLVKEGLLVEEDGIILDPKTIELVNEIEEMNRQQAIDKALATSDKKLFMQLTTQKDGEINCETH